MAIQFNVFPDYPKTTQTVTIDGVQYQLTLTWLKRTQSWYMDLSLLNGTEIVRGRRLSPGWGPMVNLLPENAPPGEFIVGGPDPYNQDTLKDVLTLRYYSDSEIPVVDSSSDLVVS